MSQEEALRALIANRVRAEYKQRRLPYPGLARFLRIERKLARNAK